MRLRLPARRFTRELDSLGLSYAWDSAGSGVVTRLEGPRGGPVAALGLWSRAPMPFAATASNAGRHGAGDFVSFPERYGGFQSRYERGIVSNRTDDQIIGSGENCDTLGSTELTGRAESDRGDLVGRSDEQRIDLSRRRAPRRILAHLARKHAKSPGAESDVFELLEAGWPDEQVHPEPGKARVYTAIGTLRELGLEEVLLTGDDGYYLDPDVSIRVPDDKANTR